MAVNCPKCHFGNPDDSQYCGRCASSLFELDQAPNPYTKTISPSGEAFLSGSLFAERYRIIEEIGRGGMGVVYKAQDTRLKRVVALKFLPPELVRDKEAKRRFVQEAQAAAVIDHRNICTVHEIDEAEGKTYISMAFIKGRSLKERIAEGSLDVRQAVHIILQVAEGLREAHENKIIHRDIKPANIMLPEKDKAKIMDFGIAKMAWGQDLTIPAAIMGTVSYMSPEQAKGGTVDHRTDIWSLGVVFYEMLTGKTPFKAEKDQATLYSIINEEPAQVSAFLKDFPQGTEEIINKCLQKDPSDRYPDMKALSSDIARLIDDLDAASTPIQKSAAPAGPKRKSPARSPLIIALSCLILAALVYFLFFFARTDEKPVELARLVVLPFENLGSPDDAYFADGMTEEITCRLAMIRALAVVSRNSALRYAGIDKTIRQIGEELHVDYVLEGTVRWTRTPDGHERVRITPQLIKVADDTHLWADTYDRVIDDVFKIQTEIAQNVIENLGITLLEPEQQAVENHPTANLEAYQAFLQGRYYAERPHFTYDNWIRVIQHYQQAVELDPGFGWAYAELARAHARLYFLRHDLSQDRLDLADKAANQALKLAPDSPKVRIALSTYYLWAHRNYEKADAELKIAQNNMPNNTDIIKARIALFETLGRFEEGIEILKTAIKLSPHDAGLPPWLAAFYWVTRQYPQAIAASNQAITLAPDEEWPYLYKIFAFWSWKGATLESRAVAEAMPHVSEWFPWTWFWQEVGEGKFRDALERVDSVPGDWIRLKTWARPKSMFSAFAHDYLKEPENAKQAFKSAQTLLEEEVKTHPDDPRYHSSLGIAYAALDRKDEAIREGKRAVELLPISKDAIYGICFLQDLALIYLLSGDHEAAIDQVERLLSIDSWVSVPFLLVNPYWKSIQDHPRFRKLMEKPPGE